MLYLLDSNVLIQAKNLHYGMDFCPAFWDFVDKEAATNTIASIQSVYDELTDGGDSLAEWIEERKNDISFLALDDQATQEKYAEIVNYVATHGFGKAHSDRFLDGADPWLIAKASILNATVVTHEQPVPANSSKVKIPNICNAFGVNYINPFEMIQRIGTQFVLS